MDKRKWAMENSGVAGYKLRARADAGADVVQDPVFLE